MDNNEDPIARTRRLANQRKARWRARQSQESLNLNRAEDAVAHRRRGGQATPEQSRPMPKLIDDDVVKRLTRKLRHVDRPRPTLIDDDVDKRLTSKLGHVDRPMLMVIDNEFIKRHPSNLRHVDKSMPMLIA